MSFNMIAFMTACGRTDLMKETLDSFQNNMSHKIPILIHEDGLRRMGQHASIHRFIIDYEKKYYLHVEEDWLFKNTYDWISKSLEILESDPTIIKVICRADAVHPCKFENGYGILDPWVDPWKNHTWYGFGWNPGVTRADLLRQFIPFPQTEQELSKAIYEAGYKVALLENGVCTHIGQDQSTHEN